MKEKLHNRIIKAPDKIYLAESDDIRDEVISNFASSTPFRTHDSIAYIRKDTLLEWAKEREKHYRNRQAEIIDPAGLDDIFFFGKEDAFKEIIAKIESL